MQRTCWEAPWSEELTLLTFSVRGNSKGNKDAALCLYRLMDSNDDGLSGPCLHLEAPSLRSTRIPLRFDPGNLLQPAEILRAATYSAANGRTFLALSIPPSAQGRKSRPEVMKVAYFYSQVPGDSSSAVVARTLKMIIAVLLVHNVAACKCDKTFFPVIYDKVPTYGEQTYAF